MVFNVILVLLLAFEFLNILFSYLNPFLLLSLFQHFSPLMASYFCSIVTKSSWIFEDSKPYFKVSSFFANSVLFFQSYFSPLIRIMFIFPVLHYLFKITMLKFFSNPYFPVSWHCHRVQRLFIMFFYLPQPVSFLPQFRGNSWYFLSTSIPRNMAISSFPQILACSLIFSSQLVLPSFLSIYFCVYSLGKLARKSSLTLDQRSYPIGGHLGKFLVRECAVIEKSTRLQGKWSSQLLILLAVWL